MPNTCNAATPGYEQQHSGQNATTLNVMEEGKDIIERVVEIQDPVEVQARILERNSRHHLKQAQETPLFDLRLVGLIHDAADNTHCEDILNGIPVDIQLEEFLEVKDFIKAMARPASIQDDG
jgi:hypothetical protein